MIEHRIYCFVEMWFQMNWFDCLYANKASHLLWQGTNGILTNKSWNQKNVKQKFLPCGFWFVLKAEKGKVIYREDAVGQTT